MDIITINDRLEYAAQDGKYENSLFLWGAQAKRLRANGLVLIKTNVPSTTRGLVHYKISWKNAKVEIPAGPFNLDSVVRDLTAQEVPLSEGNMLWLMAEEKNRK